MSLEVIFSYLQSSGFLVEEAKVFPESQVPFWHSSIIDPNGNSIASGFGEERMYARKVALSEFLERKYFREITSGDADRRKKWGLDKISTACGFAGGFDRKNAVLRSLGEAAERWVMSKWIDDGLRIPPISLKEIEAELDPVSKFLASKFDDVLFFKKTVSFKFGELPITVDIAQTMGLSGDGIFPGSSAQMLGGSIWQHAMIESFRHLMFVKNNPRRPGRFPDDKIHYFAKNAGIALERIRSATNPEWPTPEISTYTSESFLNGQYFLARSIFDGWKSWNEGPLERFLY